LTCRGIHRRQQTEVKGKEMGKSLKFAGHRVGVSLGQGKNGTTAIIVYHYKNRPKRPSGKGQA